MRALISNTNIILESVFCRAREGRTMKLDMKTMYVNE